MSDRLISAAHDEHHFDVLSDVLETLRFRGTIFFRSELAAPWGLELPPQGIPRFHISFTGDFFVGASHVDAVKVSAGEVALLPNGGSHWIADAPNRRLVASEEAGSACQLGKALFQNGTITNRIMCGLVQFDQESPHPLLSSLPEIIRFDKLQETDPIWRTISLIGSEIDRVKNFKGPIVDRLTEVLFMQLLNHYGESNAGAVGFMVALRDRRIYKALELIHAEPAFEWSLKSLGDRIGMSRATLVRHFQSSVGVAPMTYVANWRLAKAYSQIRYTQTPIDQVAADVGFSSARTLGRAFQRQYELTPSELRQMNRADV